MNPNIKKDPGVLLIERGFPWIVLALGAVYIAWIMMPARIDAPGKVGFNLRAYGALPAVDRGRVKPLDTVARSNLVILTHKQTFHEELPDPLNPRETNRVRQPAIKWMLDVQVSLPIWKEGNTFQGAAAKQKIFRIDNDQVLQLLGLQERPGFRYSLEEFLPRVRDAIMLSQKIRNKDAKQRDLYDNKLLELTDHLGVFQQLASFEVPLTIPNVGNPEDWQPLAAVIPNLREAQDDPFVMGHLKALLAYDQDKVDEFNGAVASLEKAYQKHFPEMLRASEFEIFFNRFEPFHQATVLYLFALLLGCLSWLGWMGPLNRSGFYLAILAFAVHTFAIYARMHILGRPPVINLYSSAVFIGWCAVGVCLGIELLYRNSISLVTGTFVASVTAGVIGHYLSLSGDTMEMMQAVLDTNLWLATHVTCITFGYSACFVAGFLGMIYILLGVFTPLLGRNTGPMNRDAGFGTIQPLFLDNPGGTLAKMIYGVVCFAMFLSFTGTVLGGIWADQSWGRFWGWDPKENGALLIVIWNALILHARWAGLIKQRGLANLAVAGNIVTAWSWFGTNLLGVGLHSYGFMAGTAYWLIGFAVSQLVVIGIGMIPQEYWWSFRKA